MGRAVPGYFGVDWSAGYTPATDNPIRVGRLDGPTRIEPGAWWPENMDNLTESEMAEWGRRHHGSSRNDEPDPIPTATFSGDEWGQLPTDDELRNGENFGTSIRLTGHNPGLEPGDLVQVSDGSGNYQTLRIGEAGNRNREVDESPFTYQQWSNRSDLGWIMEESSFGVARRLDSTDPQFGGTAPGIGPRYYSDGRIRPIEYTWYRPSILPVHRGVPTLHLSEYEEDAPVRNPERLYPTLEGSDVRHFVTRHRGALMVNRGICLVQTEVAMVYGDVSRVEVIPIPYRHRYNTDVLEPIFNPWR